MELLDIVHEIMESHRKGTEVANQVRKRLDLKSRTLSTSVHKAMLSEELDGSCSTLFWLLKLEEMSRFG